MNLPVDNPARAALKVVERLREADHSALFAGGCVRDLLLGLTPKDYDIATDALPQKVVELFPKSRQVGAKFGVVLVRKSGVDIEVATFRSDGEYTDHRRPDSVTFGGELDDARRRDFTINGLYFDPLAGRVIDHVGGVADLDARLLRTIGDPRMRFEEDHLRILRAVRFASRLSLTVVPDLADAARDLAPQLRSISPERIWMELERILAPPTRPQGWRWLAGWNLIEHCVSGWMPTVEERIRIEATLQFLPPDPIGASVIAAVLFADRTDLEVEEFCRALRLSNATTATTLWLVQSLRRLREGWEWELADLKTLMAGPDWSGLLLCFQADLLARRVSIAPSEEIRRRARSIDPCDVAPPPLLAGDDLLALGMKPGPAFGRILDEVYRIQLNEKIGTPQEAAALARRLMHDAR